MTALFYPPGMEKVPYRAAIVAANRYVVDHVDYLITYAWQPGSNARSLMEYARKRGKVHLTELVGEIVRFEMSRVENNLTI